MWPAVAVAALAVNAPISELPAALATAAGNTLAPFVAAELLRAFRFRLELDRVRDALAIVFLAAPAMVISATIGSLALVVSGVHPDVGFGTAWAVWLAGDATGILTVAPFLSPCACSAPIPGSSAPSTSKRPCSSSECSP